MHSGPQRANDYVKRVIAYCLSFVTFPERGTPRDDLRLGLRVIGFERRITIAFHVSADAVTIDRLFYGGRDWKANSKTLSNSSAQVLGCLRVLALESPR